jgi:hypothetical protein
MLATEPTLIRRAMNTLFMGALLCVGAAYVFRAEITDAVTDGLGKNDAAVKRKWEEGIRGKLSLRPQSNDPAFLQVTGLRSGAATQAGVPISFDLTNLGDANDFPNIAVLTVDAAGRPLRQILFSPADYNHGRRFEKERVELLVRPRHEERSFTVQGFYGEHP